MRTSIMLMLAASSTLGACKWTEFDDLEKDTWVDSTNKPDIKSADYGIAVARGNRSATTGGRLVVIGAGDPTYSELVYSDKGESSFPATSVNLKVLYGIPNVSAQPVLIADPTSDDISLVVGSDNGVALLTGAQGTLKLYQIFNQDAPAAATYMLAPTRTRALPLIAVGDSVFGAVLPALDGAPQPICKLGDSTTADFKAQIRGLGTARTGATDDVIAWDASGKLYKYPGTVFNGCATAAEPLASVDAGFAPDAGAQVIAIDDTHVLLQGHKDSAGFLRVFDVDAMTAVGDGVMVSGIRTAAILEVGADRYVAAGVPAALVDGKSTGQVQLFKLTSAGVGTVQVAALNDAQPETNQSFGRGVAAMPYNGKQVLAVAADNEIFVYFRANLADGTALYDETRTGR